MLCMCGEKGYMENHCTSCSTLMKTKKLKKNLTQNFKGVHWIIMIDYLWVGNGNMQVQGRHLKCVETKMRTMFLFYFLYLLDTCVTQMTQIQVS